VTIEVDRERVRFEVPAGAPSAVPVRVNGTDGVAAAGEPLVVAYAPAG
jgi:hypothetical protein